MENNKIINIPDPLYQGLNEYVRKSNFNSIDDFVTFILQDYLDQQKTDDRRLVDDAEVLKRLEDLGYM